MRDDHQLSWSARSTRYRWSLMALAAGLGSAGLAGWIWGSHRGGAAVAQASAHWRVPAAMLPVRSVSAQRPVLSRRTPAGEPTHRRGGRLARAFALGRSSAGFETGRYVGNMLVAEPGTVGALQAYLSDWHAMRSPTERMAAIDLLAAVAQQEGDGWESTACEAEEALVELVGEPLPAEALPEARRLLGREKHHALAALTRIDSPRALRVYQDLPRSALAAALQDALIAGLTDRGLPKAQAVAQARAASSRASAP